MDSSLDAQIHYLPPVPFGGEAGFSPADTNLDRESTDLGSSNALAADRASSVCGSVCFGPFSLRPSTRLLLRDGEPVAIGGRALDLLVALTDRAGEVVSVRELLALVWPRMVVEEANLRVGVVALRKALGDGKDGARYIVNVPGRGYIFVAPIRRAAHPAVGFVTSPAGAAASSRLPPASPSLIGRDETIESLFRHVLSRRFVTVVGPGGVGKSTVAIAAANALRGTFAEGAIYLVELGLQTDPAAVADAVALALGCHGEGLEPISSLLAFLADRRILILFDNCEHLAEAVASIAERLFRETPNVHLLVTSREALRVEGENVFWVSPLGCPPMDVHSAEQALVWPAIQLFMVRAASSGHCSELGEADAGIVCGVCRRLDGLPLAIELTASRAGAFGLRGIADLMDKCDQILLHGRRRMAPRHQSMQAVFDWSFNLLSAYEQQVLCRLSTFEGPFELEAAHEVAGNDASERQAFRGAIVTLVDKCLLDVWLRDGKTHLRFMNTTRTYAAAKFLELGEAEAAARRHTDWALSPAQRCRRHSRNYDAAATS